MRLAGQLRLGRSGAASTPLEILRSADATPADRPSTPPRTRR
ncbi:hypothetical protein I552_0358, partial [Mycobacterium xenopi 3993]